ncbi:MAG TPA: MFS transporter, partial [Nordella sp.]|nr:MFS transporter [Nordella sp.]
NATLVTRYGMRTLSKLALRVACLWSLGFLVIVFVLGGHPPLWAFVGFMIVLFFCNGLLFGNYNALAMEPMGHIAGVAAAVIGAGSSLIAVIAGTVIGRLYDGTVIPFIAGFACMEVAAFLVTEWAERGRPKRVITPS